MNVYEKLSLVQRELKAPKGQYNTFGKYHYRSCENILEAVKPQLAAARAALTLSDGMELVGERHYIVATATFIDYESGETVSVSGRAREEEEKKGMDGAQITGAASSYARKYALNGLFCIDDSRDSDATNQEEAQNGGVQPPGPPCADCGAEIMPYNDGRRKLTAAEMARRSTEMFGRALCSKCAKAEGRKAADGA